MGQGNYRVEPTEEYVGDFVQIKDSMVKIIADMKKTLSTIQVSAQEIDGGSEQLAQAATDLAEGCTAQASKISEASQMIDAMAKSIEEKPELHRRPQISPSSPHRRLLMAMPRCRN